MKKHAILSYIFVLYLLQGTAQENLHTTRIGVWPYGPAHAIAIHQDHLFVSQGRVIQIYDYANSGHPEIKGEIFMEDMIRCFAFDDGIAYVAGYSKFFILDISDFEQPAIISSMALGARAETIGLNNGYVYVVQNNKMIIIDISNVNDPQIAFVYQTNFVAYDMVIRDNIAWLASGFSGLKAYDISDPFSPDSILTYNNSGTMRSLKIVGDLLYITNSMDGIMIFDISSLPQIELLSTTPTYNLGIKIDIQGNLLAVSMLSHGFSLYDISEPTSPDSIGSFYAPWANRNTVLKDGLAIHCHVYHFNILDISSPQNMNPVSQIALSDISQYANYWENYLYINSGSGMVMTLDVTSPQQPVKVWQMEVGDGHRTVHVKDGLLFINKYGTLWIYDISEPSEPVYLNTIVAGNTILNVLKHNNILFVNTNNNLEVYDIADIYAPENLGIYPTGSMFEMAAIGNILYYVRFNDFNILDISDPGNLIQLASIENMATTSFAVKDTLAYVVASIYPSTWSPSLRILNVKDPSSVSYVANPFLSRHFEKAKIEGDYLYVFERNVGLHIFDIQGINPVLAGFYSNSRTFVNFAIDKEISYLPVWAGIDVIQNDLLTSAGNIFIERDKRLKLFPNPAFDLISFKLDDNMQTTPLSYEIIQLNGSGAKAGKLTAGQRQISLHGLPPGVYVLNVLQDGKKYKSGLFVKQ